MTNRVSFIGVDEPGSVIKSYSLSPGVCTQSGSRGRLISRLQEGKVTATATPSRDEFVGTTTKKKSTTLIKISPLFFRTNLAWPIFPKGSAVYCRGSDLVLDLVLDLSPPRSVGFCCCRGLSFDTAAGVESRARGGC